MGLDTAAEDQPPWPLYLIGIGRLLGGYQVAELNAPWNYTRDLESNVAAGAVPTSDLLWWSRLPMAVLSVVCGLGLYWLARRFAGRIGGYGVMLLFIVNPFILDALPRAMADGPLAAFAILAACAADKMLGSWRRAANRPDPLGPAGWLVVAGVMVGLAGAAKLNGLGAVCALALLAMMAPQHMRAGLARPWNTVVALGRAGLAVSIVAVTFVAVNPFTYPDPVGRTVQLFRHRSRTMNRQAARLTENAIDDYQTRLSIVPRRVLLDNAALRFRDALLVNAALSLVGVGYLLASGWRWLCGQDEPGTGAVILLFGLTLAGPALLTPLDWDRYYLFPVLFSTVAITIAISRSLQAALRRLAV